MTQTEAQRIAIRCNKLSSMAHGLYNDLMMFARSIGGQGHKLHLHEREVMHSLDAINGGLEVIAGLVQCLEGEMDRAQKQREMLENARSICKQYANACSHMHLHCKKHRKHK